MGELQKPVKHEKKDLCQEFLVFLDTQDNDLKAVLPSNVPVETFKNVVKTAIQDNPKLLNTNHDYLYKACKRCAKEGLMPDGQEAALVIWNINTSKDKEKPFYEDVAVYMPMTKGIKKRIFRNSDVVKISAHCVYENDFFDFEYGDNEFIRHKPTLTEKGDFKCVYAIFWTEKGEILRLVLSKDDVNEIREMTKGKVYDKKGKFLSYGKFWTDWYFEMAKNAVVRRLAKTIDVDIKYEEFEEEVASQQLTIDNGQLKRALPMPMDLGVVSHVPVRLEGDEGLNPPCPPFETSPQPSPTGEGVVVEEEF